MKKIYTTTRLTDNNFNDLEIIYKSAFGVNPNMNALKKKFNTSSFSEKNVGFIAYSNKNEPAAFYGVFPCNMNINGKEYLVCQSGDTMTHKDHRRNGLFVLLAKQTYKLCKSLGIYLVFGFPNENSYPGFVKKLNWIHENNIQCYRIKTQGISRKLQSKLLNYNNEFNEEYSNEILESLSCDFREYTSLNDPTNKNVIPRNNTFHDYKKYFKKYLIELNGKIIYLKISENYLYVGDIENCNIKEFKKIIHELINLSNKLNIPYIRFNISSGSPFEKSIIKYGEKMDVIYPIGYTNFIENLNLKNVHFSLLDYDTF